MVHRNRSFSVSPPTIGWSVALIYFVLLGGTVLGDVLPVLRIVNAALGGIVLVLWLRAMPQQNEFIDRAALLALLLFLAACVMSTFPRQSFDAAVAALAYVAAFYVARRLMRDPSTRRFTVVTMRLILLGLLIGVVAIWGSTWLRWLDLTEWETAPPLDLPLPAGVWGHKHDLVLLLVLLAPAVLPQTRTKRKTALATALLAIVAALVVLDGSRNLWLAIAIAFVVTGALVARRWALRHTQQLKTIGLVALFGVVATFVFTDLGKQVLIRMADVQTLGARFEQWRAAVALWSGDPLQGMGPGSYPFLMRLTDYFTRNSYVSRHPDGAVVQTLVETGLLGLAATAVLVIAAIIALTKTPRSRDMPRGIFVLVVFAFAGLAANPADYGFPIVVAICWLALLLPAEAKHQGSSSSSRSLLRSAIPAMTGLIALAVGTSNIAAVAYAQASKRVAQQDYDGTIELLSMAASLDPGMALYPRERASARLLEGDYAGAISDADAAIRLNAADDVAFRLKAFGELGLGHRESAADAAAAATARVWTDLTNQQLVAISAPNDAVALNALAATVETAPWIAASSRWNGLIPSSHGLDDVLEIASRDLRSGAMPRASILGGVWVAAEDGDAGVVQDQLEQVSGLKLTAAALAGLLACRNEEALASIRQAEKSEGIEPQYWVVRAIIERQNGIHDPRTTAVGSLLSPGLAIEADGMPAPPDTLSGGLRDQWGYRRLPMEHPALASSIVSGSQAMAELLNPPVGQPVLGSCREQG